MKRATIGDVAVLAGVSTATVSRVVNGGTVAEATAVRVRDAITRLAYSPNALTRSIFTGRSSTVGVVIRDLTSPFYLDLIRGIDEVAAAGGSLVVLANTFRRADREVSQVRAMDEQRVRGLIVTTDAATDGDLRRMADNGTPCVVVSRSAPGLASVRLDDVRAGRLMAAHLATCGRSRIGVVTAGPRPSQIERVAGLDVPDERVVAAESPEAVPGAVDTLLTRHRLDAIVCTSGRLTAAVHSALTARGLVAPDDVAFLTMDDFAWAAALGVTVVAQPAYEMGRSAAGLVVDPPGERASRVFAPTLIPRASCGESLR